MPAHSHVKSQALPLNCPKERLIFSVRITYIPNGAHMPLTGQAANIVYLLTSEQTLLLWEFPQNETGSRKSVVSYVTAGLVSTLQAPVLSICFFHPTKSCKKQSDASAISDTVWLVCAQQTGRTFYSFCPQYETFFSIPYKSISPPWRLKYEYCCRPTRTPMTFAVLAHVRGWGGGIRLRDINEQLCFGRAS